MDVVNASAPELLRLDLMDEESLTPYIVFYTLVERVLKIGTLIDLWSVNLSWAESTQLFAAIQMRESVHFTSIYFL